MNHEVFEIYNNNTRDKKKEIDIYFLEVEDIESKMIGDLNPQKNMEFKKKREI